MYFTYLLTNLLTYYIMKTTMTYTQLLWNANRKSYMYMIYLTMSSPMTLENV